MSVEVKQVDREAWAQWMAASCLGPDHAIIQQIRDGLEDNDGPNLLAAHRHQAEEAMRERISMLEKLLSDCADELAAEVEARFERVWGHPGMRHKIERDMNTVVAARAAIRSIDTRGE